MCALFEIQLWDTMVIKFLENICKLLFLILLCCVKKKIVKGQFTCFIKKRKGKKGIQYGTNVETDFF